MNQPKSLIGDNAGSSATLSETIAESSWGRREPHPLRRGLEGITLPAP